MKDETRLFSSATNIVTAYEDDEEKRISLKQILNYKNCDLRVAIKQVCNNVLSHLDDIEKFIYSIPNDYDGTEIMSDIRKKLFFYF